MIPQETTFTIGQFAAIHGIHKKTLMWYDQVGLLSPAFVGENGYRYYSYRQSARLETILMLRALEVSIPEIKTFLSHRSAGELRRLLTEKIAGVEGQIRRLEEIRHALVRQQASLARLETLPLTQISLVRRETCYLATVPLPGDTPTDREIAAVIDQAKAHQLGHLHEGVYGAMLPVEHLRQGRFTDYTHLFLEVPAPTRRTGLHRRPKGRYLLAYYQGPWQGLPAKYEAILAYARDHELTLTGFAYEKGVNELVIQQDEDYITQLESPVQDPCSDGSSPRSHRTT